MANLKTLLASLLDSNLNNSTTKNLMSESAAPDYQSTVTITNQQSASPYDGICIMKSEILATGNFGVFIYVNGVKSLTVSGARSSGSVGMTHFSFIPVKKGDVVLGDFDNAKFVEFVFVKSSGASS